MIPTPQPFKEEFWFNSLKLVKKQIVRYSDISFSEIQNIPNTLSWYGITDAVQKIWIDEKLEQMEEKIKTLEIRIQELEKRIP